MPATIPVEPLTLLFADDGLIPNNPTLPMLVYRHAFDFAQERAPEERIEKTFGDNGWGDMWRYGIYPYVHFHSAIHEVLGVARGRAKVRFGGNNGEVLELEPGDVALLPAGTGHQCLWSSPEFCVVGAYPKQGRYDLCRASEAEHDKALRSIPETPLPDSDPLYGEHGPAMRLWHA
ncbi:MAG TPA: hypothetical protein VFB45_23625 [Pseudolabrys sp.]|nr:hypothetical protein [Pseudolabrys sp.]